MTCSDVAELRDSDTTEVWPEISVISSNMSNGRPKINRAMYDYTQSYL